MKTRRPKTPSVDETTFERRALLVQSVFDTYLRPRLQEPLSPHESPRRYVSWDLSRASTGAFSLSVRVRYGPMIDMEHITVHSFGSLYSLHREAAMNALFNALSFNGSPYYWAGEQWDKRGEIMG